MVDLRFKYMRKAKFTSLGMSKCVGSQTVKPKFLRDAWQKQNTAHLAFTAAQKFVVKRAYSSYTA